MDATGLWSEACNLLRAEMNEVSYQTWIKANLSPLRMDGDQLVLLTPGAYMKTMIQSRYQAVISDALTQVAGKPVQANIITQEEDIIPPADDPAAGSGISSQPLNPKYTFQSFVVGSNNRLAHAASLAVAETPAQAYNPLFIYGGVGLGKTHLMHAIGHFVQEEHPEMKLLYITSEDFTNELIAAIQQGRNAAFRNRFRYADILMVDDIQFIAGRETTQEEFFHTFNALMAAGKQIILTSDRPPKDIARLEERLRSRFEGGLTTDIQRPDLDTRIAILRKKAMEDADMWQIDDAVLEMIATRVASNIRELEGAYNRLRAYAKLTGKPITPELCQEALKSIFADNTRVITSSVIIDATAAYYSLSAEDLTGSSRRREITVPRQVAMFLCREMTGMSLPQIGQAFGNRDHTTVLYSCNTVAAGIKDSVNMANLVDDIRRQIREGK